MSSQSQAQVPTPPQRLPEQQVLQSVLSGSNSAAQERLGAQSNASAGGAGTPDTVNKGNCNYTIAEGDTLRKISKATYGFDGYWDKIRDENPSFIFNQGTCFMVGDNIHLPGLDVPVDSSAGPPVATGGISAAFRPERKNTDWGTYLIYPDAYHVSPLPAPEKEKALHQSEFLIEITRLSLEAAGTAVLGQQSLNEKLDYGLFDWEVTEADATSAMLSLASRPYSMIYPSVLAMGFPRFQRLLDNLPSDQKSTIEWAKVGAATGQISDPAELKAAFDRLPDVEVLAMQALLKKRFLVKIGEKGGNAWTAPALRRLWTLLEQLPPSAVQDNDRLDMILRDGGGAGSGYYSGGNQQAVVGYGADLNQTGSYGQIMAPDGAGGEKDVGLHSNVNLFDTVVRHEIGHAVDAKIGASKGYATTADNAGQWKSYGSSKDFVDGLIETGGGLGNDEKAESWKTAMVKAVEELKDFNTALAELKNEGKVPQNTPSADNTAPAPIQGILTPEVWTSGSSPWYGNKQGTVGNRRFHQSYGGNNYVSYLAESREKYGVSAYQFRAPGEWFAEAYACYYSDHPDVNGKDPGTRLRTRDAATADWFDKNVNPTNPLPTGGGGGGSHSTPSGMGTQDRNPASA